MAHSATLVLFLLTTLPSPTLQQINYQPDSSDREYCYHESNELGLCLGRQYNDYGLKDYTLLILVETLSFSIPIYHLTDDLIFDCIQCSGPYRGDETCSELKALNNSTSNTTVLIGEGEKLSFCQTYNYCVQTKCPPQCWKEHVRWLECAMVELDCDLGCQSPDHGGGFADEEIALGVLNSGIRRKDRFFAKVLVAMFGLWLVHDVIYAGF
ncbi:hypothetical protein HJC23_013962 [Cyclotella cryptica]|uniref:Uncharacterized protein n=1 Tax=Cyclotella cryptica TaxID=29204 RepID=A0ABD3Q3Q4_9STRA